MAGVAVVAAMPTVDAASAVIARNFLMFLPR